MAPDDLDFLDEAENPAPEPKAKRGKAKAASAPEPEPEGPKLVKVKIVGNRLPRAETHAPDEDPRQLQDGEIVEVTEATADKWEEAGAARRIL